MRRSGSAAAAAAAAAGGASDTASDAQALEYCWWGQRLLLPSFGSAEEVAVARDVLTLWAAVKAGDDPEQEQYSHIAPLLSGVGGPAATSGAVSAGRALLDMCRQNQWAQLPQVLSQMWERGLLRQLAAKAVAKRQQQLERQQQQQQGDQRPLSMAPAAERGGADQVGMLQGQQPAGGACPPAGDRPADAAQPAAQRLGKRRQAASSGGPSGQLVPAGIAKRRSGPGAAARTAAPITQAGVLASGKAQPHALSRSFKGAVLTSGVWTKRVTLSGLSRTCCLSVPGECVCSLCRLCLAVPLQCACSWSSLQALCAETAKCHTVVPYWLQPAWSIRSFQPLASDSA
jgi:hypothetical protein